MDELSPALVIGDNPGWQNGVCCLSKSMGFMWQSDSVASLCIGDEVSPTLRTCQTPAVCGVVAIEGNGTRESHRGDGYKETETMYTLNTTEQHKVAYAIDQQGGKGMCGYGVDVCPTLCSDSHGTPHAVAYALQNNQSDARLKICEDGVVQTLLGRMGTGGNNTPMVLQQTPFVKTRRAKDKDDYTSWENKETANTLNALDVGETRCNELVVEAIGVDMYNQDITGDKSSTIGTNCGMSTGRNGVMTYSFDRRNQSASKETMNTLTADGGGDNQPTVFCMATQQGNAEIGDNLCPITAMAGMSGNNQPVAFIPKAYGLELGATIRGQGDRIYEELVQTLRANAGDNKASALIPKAFNIDSLTSNSMLSSNPHSGFHETQVSKCLDASGPDPTKNQGGTVILQPTTVEIMNPWDSQGNQITNSVGKKVYPCLRGCGGGGYQQGYVFHPSVVDIGGNESIQPSGIECLTPCDNQTRRVYGVNGVYPTLTVGADSSGQNQQSVCYAVDMGGGKSSVMIDEDVSPTLTTTHYGAPAVCVGVDVYNQSLTGDKSKTLNSAASDADHVPCVCMETSFFYSCEDTAPTLKARDYKDPPCVALETFHCVWDSVVPSLKQRDYKDPQVVCIFRGDGIDGEDKSFCLIGSHESSISDYTNLILAKDNSSEPLNFKASGEAGGGEHSASQGTTNQE